MLAGGPLECTQSHLKRNLRRDIDDYKFIYIRKVWDEKRLEFSFSVYPPSVPKCAVPSESRFL